MAQANRVEGGGQKSAVFDYWASGRGINHVTPPPNRAPEGSAFLGYLSRKFEGDVVCEFGCGTGRLAPCFAPQLYVGVDICSAAIEMARRLYPNYWFMHLLPDDERRLPTADVLLAHTVMLHIPDDELISTVERFAHYPRVVVSEILGRHWRRDGLPPVFNREKRDYEDAFSTIGFALKAEEFRPYPHYENTDLAILEFEPNA